MDQLSAMNAFVRVVETGSFSAAARQLRLGQPAVSKAVAKLEERLGVRLLARTTRGLAPTDAGQSFYERARRAIEEVEEAEIAARGEATALTGRLRVATAVTFGRLHIIPHMKEFLALNPALEVEFSMDDGSIDLVEEGVDIALRMGVPATSPITGRVLARGKRVVLATPAYLAEFGTPSSPHDLVRHSAVANTQSGYPASWTFTRGAEERQVTLAGRLRVDAGEGVRAAVLAGIGLAVASEWLFASELESGLVQPVLTDWSLPPIELWALFPTGRLANSKARHFAEFVRSKLDGNAASAFTKGRRAGIEPAPPA